MRGKVTIGILGILILLAGSSCIKELEADFESLNYNPKVSVPIGTLNYSLGDIMPPSALQLPVPDTTLIPDSIPLIFYNDQQFFVNPTAGYDTSFVQPIDISALQENSQHLTYLMLRSNVTNDIPTEMHLQVYFLNRVGFAIDSAYHNGPELIPLPKIDASGIISEPSFVTIDTEFNLNNISQILQTTQLLIYVHLQTYSNESHNLRVFDTNGLQIQLALRAEIMTPLEL